MQEKDILKKDLKKLRNHCSKYEPVIFEVTKRYERAMRNKSLVCIERDKLKAKVNALELTVKQLSSSNKKNNNNNTNNNSIKK
jgi:hypothetical protein